MPTTTLPSLAVMHLQVQDHIAHLQLNQPERLNTMHPAFWRDLDAALEHLQRRPDVRVLVLSSTGKHFSAGMALETFANPDFIPQDRSPEGRAALSEFLWDMQQAFTRLDNLRIPVIAAIQGGCIGGALDLVCCACLRYATQDAFFCVQEINIGMVADLGSLQRLPKLLPMGLVKELAYTGRRWPAEAALAQGFVNGVHATQDAMLDAAMACAREIAAKPPIAIWGSKQALQFARDHSVDDSLRQMGWLQAGIWSNRHVQEAVQASQARRPGDFPPLAPQQRFADLG
ncbi:UNVERIFIED_ORG: enoyl-CoA hydratase [Comamonas terrigena]